MGWSVYRADLFSHLKLRVQMIEYSSIAFVVESRRWQRMLWTPYRRNCVPFKIKTTTTKHLQANEQKDERTNQQIRKYAPSVNTFPTSLAAMTVSMSGSTYCMSPVASRIITVREIVMRAIPPVMAGGKREGVRSE